MTIDLEVTAELEAPDEAEPTAELEIPDEDALKSNPSEVGRSIAESNPSARPLSEDRVDEEFFGAEEDTQIADQGSIDHGSVDLDALGSKTLVAKPSADLIQEMFGQGSNGIETVRLTPDDNQAFQRVSATQQGAETVKLPPTQLGLPTLQPQDDLSEGTQPIPSIESSLGPETIRVMPQLSSNGPHEEVSLPEADAVQELDTLDTTKSEEEPSTIELSEIATDEVTEATDLQGEFISGEIAETETRLSPVSSVEVQSESTVDEDPVNETAPLDKDSDHEPGEGV